MHLCFSDMHKCFITLVCSLLHDLLQCEIVTIFDCVQYTPASTKLKQVWFCVRLIRIFANVKSVLLSVVMLIMLSLFARAGQWQASHVNPLLEGGDAYSLAFDRGRLLVGGSRELLTVDATGAITRITLLNRHGGQGGSVRRISVSPQGDTLTALSGVYILKGNKAHRLRDASPTELEQRRFVAPDGAVWTYSIQSPDAVRLLGSDTVPLPTALKGKIITDICAAGLTMLAIATNNDGVYLLNLNSGELTNMRRSLSEKNSLPGNHVMGVAYDAARRLLYVAIPHNGVFYTEISPSAVEIVSTGVEEEVSGFAVDCRNRLWVAYDGAGIQLMNPDIKVVRHLTSASAGLPGDIITGLRQMPDSSMAVMTYGHGVFSISAEGKISLLSGLGKDSDAAQSRNLAVDRFGNLWLSTFSRGVVRRSPQGDVRVFNTENSALRTNYITDIIAAPGGDSILVATGFGLYSFNASKLSSSEIPCVSEDTEKISVRMMAFDNAGKLWMATPDGVTDARGNIVALKGIPIKAIVAAEGTAVWCTSDSAVYRLDTATNPVEVKTFNAPKGLKFGYYALFVRPGGTVLAGGFGRFVIVSDDSLPVILNDSESSSGLGLMFGIISGCLLLIGAVTALLRHYSLTSVRNAGTQSAITVAQAPRPEPEIKETETAANDKAWLAMVDAIIDEHMADIDFGVEQLSAAAMMSRSNFYKRMIALTGTTPQEYLRNRRVETGRRILARNTESRIKPTLSEVAYQIGLSPRQFSKYLRQNGEG